MSVPAGHVLTIGGLAILDRLQDAGLQNPKVPTTTVYETGNDLVVGKVLGEADFSFQLTSWDVSCDLMALLNGKKGALSEGPSHGDPNGTTYKWENCQFINLACPWARDTGTQGGHIQSGVVIPAFYATALDYKFGVAAMAEQRVTLQGGAYYQSEAFPIEEFYVVKKTDIEAKSLSIETKETARPYRIGGAGGTTYRAVFGVLHNGVILQEGVDYVEEGTPKTTEEKKVKVKFLKFETHFAEGDVIRFCYLTAEKVHAIPQEAHVSTTVKPAAVRGRNIDILLGPHGSTTLLHGVQDFSLSATHRGTVQRELGFQDPIGFNEEGVDTTGSFTLNPKEGTSLYEALEKLTGIDTSTVGKEALGYINEFPVPLTAVIYNPAHPSEVIKSIYIADAIFQPPGTDAKANSTVNLPISWESLNGTFEEIKGELP